MRNTEQGAVQFRPYRHSQFILELVLLSARLPIHTTKRD
jgi:hypothetical protein